MLSISQITLAWILGIIWGLYFRHYAWGLALIFFIIWMLMVIYERQNEKDNLFRKHACLLILMIISFLSYGYFSFRQNQFLYTYEEGSIDAQLTIVQSVGKSYYYEKYTVKNTKGHCFLLYVKKTNPPLQKGDLIQVKGEYERPDFVRNRIGFNEQLYYFSNGLYGKVIVSEYKELNVPHHFFYDMQNNVDEKIRLLFPSDVTGILKAMLMGEKEEIYDDVKEQFEKSGLLHLLAISGTHMVSIANLALFLLKKSVGKRYAYVMMVPLVTFFIIFTHASPSVVRAGMMVILPLIAFLTRRKSNSYENLSLAALILLVMNPYVILHTGFLLSFVRYDWHLMDFSLNYKTIKSIFSIPFSSTVSWPNYIDSNYSFAYSGNFISFGFYDISCFQFISATSDGFCHHDERHNNHNFLFLFPYC